MQLSEDRGWCVITSRQLRTALLEAAAVRRTNNVRDPSPLYTLPSALASYEYFVHFHVYVRRISVLISAAELIMSAAYFQDFASSYLENHQLLRQHHPLWSRLCPL